MGTHARQIPDVLRGPNSAGVVNGMAEQHVDFRQWETSNINRNNIGGSDRQDWNQKLPTAVVGHWDADSATTLTVAGERVQTIHVFGVHHIDCKVGSYLEKVGDWIDAVNGRLAYPVDYIMTQPAVVFNMRGRSTQTYCCGFRAGSNYLLQSLRGVT